MDTEVYNSSQYTNKNTDDILPKHFPPILTTHHHILVVFAAYFLLVKILGPKIMTNRKPFQLKTPIMVYNLSQIVMNIYIMSLYWKLMGRSGLYLLDNVCHPVTSANVNDPQIQDKIVIAMYYYYVNKILDLLDTIFFTLRKKESQITFLHLFHHTTMVLSTWTSIVFIREEVSVILAGVNSFIHIVMYTYYLLSSFGPSIQKYLWWKKYITRMQIVQFLIGLAILVKMEYGGCKANPLFVWLWIANVSIFLGLFTQFYVQSYMKKKSKTV